MATRAPQRGTDRASSATVRYVAQYRELGQEQMLIRTVSASFWILLGLGAVAFIIGVALTPLVPVAFKVPGQETATSVLVVLVAAAIGAVIVGGDFQGCLGGLQRYSLLSTFYIGAAIAQTVAFALALMLGGGLVGLGVALLVVTPSEQTARYIAVRRCVPQLTLSPRIFNRAFAKEIFRVSAWISSTHLATAIRYRIDTIVVGFVAGGRVCRRPTALRRSRPLHPPGAHRILSVLGRACRAPRGRASPRSDAHGHSCCARGRRASLRHRNRARRAGSARVGRRGGTAGLALSWCTHCPLSCSQRSAEPDCSCFRDPGRSGDRRSSSGGGDSQLRAQHRPRTGDRHDRCRLATLIATAAVSTLIGIPYMCRMFDVSVWRFLLAIARAHVPAVGVALATGWILAPSKNADLLAVVAAGAAIGGAYLLTLTFTGLTREERRHVWNRIRRADSRAVSEA